jgi:hypothetical protein
VAGAENTRDRPDHGGALLLAALVAAAFASGTVAIACLPDLAPIVNESPSPDAATSGCGDGIIATLDDGGDAGESCDPGSADPNALGCHSCQITCEPGGVIDPASGHCYFVPEPTAVNNDQDLFTTCQTLGAHPVTLGSNAEVSIVATLFAKKSIAAGGYWVGLSRNPSLPYRTTRLDIFGQADEPGYPYPPAGGSGAGPCAGCFGVGADGGVFSTEDASVTDSLCIAARDGAWFQVACAGGPLRTVVCEREPRGVRASYCAGGYCFTVPATAKTKSYEVFVGQADPASAAATCAAIDGSLVVIESAEEREQLAQEIFSRDPTAVEQQLWIGLGRDGGGDWTWDDGIPTSARPAPWGNAEPDASSAGGRAYMRLRSGTYDTQLAHADDGLAAPRIFICQRPLASPPDGP